MKPGCLFAQVTLRDKGLCILYSIFISYLCPRATVGNITSENLTIQVHIFSFFHAHALRYEHGAQNVFFFFFWRDAIIFTIA